MKCCASQLMMDLPAAVATWPALVVLSLICCLLFGYLVPKAKAPVFANVGAKLAHKLPDEFLPSWTPHIADRFLAAIGPDRRAA